MSDLKNLHSVELMPLKLLEQKLDIASSLAASKNFHADRHAKLKKTKSLGTTNQGSWEYIGNTFQIFSNGVGTNPQLMTDGTIILFGFTIPQTGKVWKLTPDIFGKYETGTWSQVAPLPTIGTRQYTPLLFPSAVLADGRLIIAGGDFQGPDHSSIWTPEGSEGANYVAIYDPFTDTWSQVDSPTFFGNNYGPRKAITPHPIGVVSSVVLEDGTWMIEDQMTTQAALLDPKKRTWTETGTKSKAPHWNQNEHLTLLPDGQVLTVNCYSESGFCPCPLSSACSNCYPYPENPTGSQIYDPKCGIWKDGGSTKHTLTSPITFTIGNSILRPDGTVFYTGVNGDNNSIYDSKSGIWSVAPPLPLLPVLYGFLNISAPTEVEGSYELPQVILPSGGANNSPFSKTANIVPTIPANATGGPYDPSFPAGSIALIKISLQDLENNNTADIDSVQAAKDVGAIGVIFDDLDLVPLGFTLSGDYVLPMLLIEQPLGNQLVKYSTGLRGTMSSSYIDKKLTTFNKAGVLLPNGNVLFSAAQVSNPYGYTSAFLNFNGSDYSFEPLPPTSSGIYFLENFVGLPTGQIFSIDRVDGDLNLYTPANQNYNPDWAPCIVSYPKVVKDGKTYPIDGYLFNGMSQTSNGNPLYQAPTNYPLVRITNNATGHVFYCRTHDHSYMGVAAVDKHVHTFFDVPSTWAGHPIEYGPSKLEVVANGIPSQPVDITVKDPPTSTPKILCYPDKIKASKSYSIKIANLPDVVTTLVVKITNRKSGDSVEANLNDKACNPKCKSFTVPKDIQSGKSYLQVVANDVPSDSKKICVK